MNDESKRTHTAREIVLELFPATDEKLVPGLDEYRFERRGNGDVVIHDLSAQQTLVLTPISAAGNSTTTLCCDLCHRSAPRRYLQMFRVTLPGSQGRRFRYVSLCRDIQECDARRIDDEPLRVLLTSVLEP